MLMEGVFNNPTLGLVNIYNSPANFDLFVSPFVIASYQAANWSVNSLEFNHFDVLIAKEFR